MCLCLVLHIYFVFENCDITMHLLLNFDYYPMHSPFGFCAFDTSKFQCLHYVSQFTLKSKYAFINP